MRVTIRIALVASIVWVLAPSQSFAFENVPPFLLQWGSQGNGDGQFQMPYAIAVGPQGYVYVSDQGIPRIQVFTGSGSFVTKWGSFGDTPGHFVDVQGIAVGPNGDVYVSESRRIQRFSPTGTFIQQWGTSGTGPGQFRSAHGMAFDSQGRIYIADSENDRIHKFTADGVFLSSWGTKGTGPGQFDAPYNVAIDQSDNVYIGDIGNYRIVKFRPDSTFVTQWDGTIQDSTAYYGFGMAVDPYGHIYDPSWGYYRIRVWDSDGTLQYHWGQLGSGPSEFNRIIGVAIDSGMNLYVADRDNDRIQKFFIGGIVSAGEEKRPTALSIRIGGSPVIQGRSRVEVVGLPNAPVHVEFFDVQGRRVHGIDSVTEGTGHWSAPWPNGIGGPGVQFVRVRQFNSSAVAKVVLTR